MALECVYGIACKLADYFLYGVHRFVSYAIVLHNTGLGQKCFECCRDYDLFIQLMEGYFVLKKYGHWNIEKIIGHVMVEIWNIPL